MNDNTTESPTNSYIDDITLQLISNKTQYNKYLNVSNPERNNELQEYYETIKRHKNDIVGILDDYIDDPKTQISSDMNNALETFMKACLKHFELKEAENKNAFHYVENQDDDMMFGSIDNTPPKETCHTLWGENVRKL